MSEREIRLRLPDGSERRVPAGTTAREVAQSIGARLAKAALAAKVNGEVVDLDRPLQEDAEIRILTFEDEEGRAVFRHSSTHVLAQAVKRLWPEAKLGTGPALEDGFYYDIDLPHAPSEEDLARIEEEMRRIVEADYPIVREEWPREKARAFFLERNEPYKVEIVDDLPPDATISVYRQGEFVDLCRGPHVPSTGRIRHFKLLSVSGAYWRAKEGNPVLQRIYGTSFERKEDLEHFLWAREEAKKRDHRRLGPELDLFTFHEEAPGFAFWHPKGWIFYRELERLSREVQERHGYQEVRTPYIYRAELWKTSGHWEHYRDNMFLTEREDEVFGFKPMNCPGHCILYKEKIRSYRDLPLRISEYGPLARCERSGALHGLLRVRGFHQDDAHLFVREDQIEDEIRDVIEIVDEIYSTFGMRYRIVLSTRPEDYMGELALWEKAEAQLAQALQSLGRDFRLNPGDGAFYGPKLDFYVTDALGREWQTATVQLDFQLPVRFDLHYVDRDGQERRPVMIHRAILGSIERFAGILVEHFAGDFPLWLAPVQARVLTVTDEVKGYGAGVRDRLKAAGLRVELDDRSEKIGYKIRQAELEKVPYMLVVGRREAEAGLLAVRSRRGGDEGAMPVEAFAATALERVRSRAL
ncbi:MAG: threonine--tRNA ligase [Firmicutes bacterium]|nr:threonine--tRNA ligase [Bacillota bacterium]